MAHAYTPGLKVTEKYMLHKKRILPIKGDVLVKAGDPIEPTTVLARTFLPGKVEPFNVANVLGVEPREVKEHMLKQEGEAIKKDEVIAMSKSFFGMFKSEVKAPFDGTVESISSITGQIILRGQPVPIEVRGYTYGKVEEVIPREGVILSTWCSFIQGIFGIGGETHGELACALESRTEILDKQHFKPEHKGKIVFGGSRVTAEGLREAIRLGVHGVVTAGFDDKDLRDFLGKDLGVAITGNEDLGVTLVITEGFGKITMAERTYSLLQKNIGKVASINGATQIRAGVIRPEVIIPRIGEVPAVDDLVHEITGIMEGIQVRVIRNPRFGEIGTVTALPSPLQTLESESHARVLELEFEDKVRMIMPRANVELIEE